MSFYPRPWAKTVDEQRRGLTLGLIHLPGRHRAQELSRAIAKDLAAVYNVSPKRIILRLDKYDEETDIPTSALSIITDAGGGAPAVDRRLGIAKDICHLHGLDLFHGHGYCLARNANPAIPTDPGVTTATKTPPST